MPRPVCPKCGDENTSRKKREGPLQILIYPRLGWFPWECGVCRKVFVVKERGKSKRRPVVLSEQQRTPDLSAGEDASPASGSPRER